MGLVLIDLGKLVELFKEVLSEALTVILTEISDKGSQILVTVVNRWKRLSEELKKVVLAVTDIA